jgi:hypothetical protein
MEGMTHRRRSTTLAEVANAAVLIAIARHTRKLPDARILQGTGSVINNMTPNVAPTGPFEARYLAFLETVSQIRPTLHRYCSRMTGSVVDGEDVVQDAPLRTRPGFTLASFLPVRLPKCLSRCFSTKPLAAGSCY